MGESKQMELRAIKELVVYRDLWDRGSKNNGSLLSENGMCCLGFACEAIGVPAKALYRTGEPLDLELDEALPGLTDWEDGRLTTCSLTGQAIAINDCPTIGDEERERGLGVVFAKGDIEISFEDTAPPHIRQAYEDGLNG